MKTINIKEYNEFYKKNKRAIHYFILKMTHDEMATEELVNDVFVKVYQNMEKFDDSKSSFKTWVHNIATNATIDFLRKKRLQTKSIDEMISDDETRYSIKMEFASNEADPLHQLMTAESHLSIDKAIKTLPALQAEILRQLSIGITYDEIAEELGMPIGTVKGSIHLARTRMKELFNKTLNK